MAQNKIIIFPGDSKKYNITVDHCTSRTEESLFVNIAKLPWKETIISPCPDFPDLANKDGITIIILLTLVSQIW